jgi:hypothetical protein
MLERALTPETLYRDLVKRFPFDVRHQLLKKKNILCLQATVIFSRDVPHKIPVEI